jgi:hypothetical protein
MNKYLIGGIISLETLIIIGLIILIVVFWRSRVGEKNPTMRMPNDSNIVDALEKLRKRNVTEKSELSRLVSELNNLRSSPETGKKNRYRIAALNHILCHKGEKNYC